ncbi:MAG: hypothetical protein HQL49_04375 [Gammaproteobacteria bacterium]|nr:hypothetical protein [Gammaproteobacteria bacterium]
MNKTQKGRCHVTTSPFVLLFFLLPLFAPVAIAADDTPLVVSEVGVKASEPGWEREQVRQRALRFEKVGAGELAVGLLESATPPFADLEIWVRWQRLVLQMLQRQQQWPAILKRIESYPLSLPDYFQQELIPLRVTALLASERFSEVRSTLFAEIWQQPYHAQKLQQWRLWLIESYLGDGLGGDATLAMQRFLHDYPDSARQILQLQARVLLASGNAAEAEQLLISLKGPLNPYLINLARVRQQHGVRGILTATLEGLSSETLTQEQRLLALQVVTEAAAQLSDIPAEIQALEALARMPNDVSLEFRLPQQREGALLQANSVGDRLWDAYFRYAVYIANRDQLLIGDDQSWFAFAEKQQIAPILQRSLYAYLAYHSRDQQPRQRAHELLSQHHLKVKGSELLIQQLYNKSSKIKELSEIPTTALETLLDMAIRDRQLRLASDIMAQLQPPQALQARFTWQLRYVRLHFLNGELDKGADLLAKMIPDLAKLESLYWDQLLQLLFELQGGDQHAVALKLMQQLYQQSQRSAPELQRELLYWMAESHDALGESVQAAARYLESADHLRVGDMDPWAQTARYHAARALVKAALSRDAATIFKQLLRVTSQTARRAQIIQELNLLGVEVDSVSNAAAAVLDETPPAEVAPKPPAKESAAKGKSEKSPPTSKPAASKPANSKAVADP